MNTEPSPEGNLSNSDFETIIRLAPLVSIDIAARLKDGQVLLGHRINEPAKGTFFLVGGRVRKNETLEEAFRRITLEEIGVQKEIKDARFIGWGDHFYETNKFEKPGFGTRYVALGYEITLTERPDPPKIQHDAYDWRTEDEILKSTDVHEYTKAYFRPAHIRSESQYTALATRRNALNTMLWQTPALSLSALAFLLNVAGNRNAYREIRVVTCILALCVALFTLQLFIRHRRMEKRDSLLLEEFEIHNRHLGYAVINSRFNTPIPRILARIKSRISAWMRLPILAWIRSHVLKWINPANWSSYWFWILLFLIFTAASGYLLRLNLKDSWQETPAANSGAGTNAPPGRAVTTGQTSQQATAATQSPSKEPAPAPAPPLDAQGTPAAPPPAASTTQSAISPQTSPTTLPATNPPPDPAATTTPASTNAPGENKHDPSH
jgi:colanic acid biosynthesis protein WcaH